MLIILTEVFFCISYFPWFLGEKNIKGNVAQIFILHSGAISITIYGD